VPNAGLTVRIRSASAMFSFGRCVGLAVICLGAGSWALDLGRPQASDRRLLPVDAFLGLFLGRSA